MVVIRDAQGSSGLIGAGHVLQRVHELGERENVDSGRDLGERRKPDPRLIRGRCWCRCRHRGGKVDGETTRGGVTRGVYIGGYVTTANSRS